MRDLEAKEIILEVAPAAADAACEILKNTPLSDFI
jgi:hypothetical protein